LRVRLIALAFLSVLLACSRGGEALPGLGIDVAATSVSGLSAGAYMAGQLQVAHSKQIVGAGIVAGGPFGCAENEANSFLPSIAKNISQAFEDCLNGRGIPDATALVERAKGLAKAGEIDPLADLSKDRVYLFSGGKDQIVARSVVEAAKRFYIDAGVPQENVALMTREDAGHSILTTDTGNACGLSASPFVSDCDYDQAGAILKWIYGELNAPAKSRLERHQKASLNAFP
jgi:poly(3-hydroxybutyrate) depolymerase